jgi:hypothetical protein
MKTESTTAKLRFGDSLGLPIVEFASQGNAILGIRDSGKTYTATWLAERLLDHGIPFVAFDPIGVWRFLKVPGRAAASGYNVVVAGYAASGGGYNNALSRLRAQGIIHGTNSLKLTESGREYVERNGKEILPTGSALAQYWMRQLPRAERAILTVLTEPPRRTRSEAELGIQTGYEPSGGGFNNALSRLRTLLLIEGKTDLVASDRLFD